MADDSATSAAGERETIETFLNELCKSLEAQDGVDKELLAILGSHLLVATPTADAVMQAKVEIQNLASRRANAGKR